jgi:ubiquinone/menaquinone biosynthesis C-methylase UbiE
MTTASTTYFEQVAEQWDTLRTGYFTEAVRESAIAKAYLRPEMVVADVGAGTGFMTAGLAPLVSRVYVLDGSAAMLAVARRNLAQFDNVEFHEADGQSLPLPDGSVDAVFANMYLHHCPDPLAAIREMVRVLRPGGRLVITDVDTHSYEWMRQEMADVWLGFDRAQIRAWFREAGLVNILVDCTGESCCAESKNPAITDASGREAKISVFVATGSTRVLGTQEEVQAHYGEHAESGCSCSGTPQDGADSCCSSQEQASNALQIGYSTEELAQIPAEAANLSLGCGNPVAIASLRSGQVVLDIGSGGGIDAFYAAKRVGPTGKVIGLDMTPQMIERASKSAAEAGLSQVEFRLGNAQAMPIEDGTVDVILSNCVINLAEDKGKVFEEAYRVLKGGGRLSISDIVTEQALPMSLRGDAAKWGSCVHGALPEREYLDLIAQAGFQEIKATPTEIGGEFEGVRVYSLSVSARKGKATDDVSEVIPLKLATTQRKSCCG